MRKALVTFSLATFLIGWHPVLAEQSSQAGDASTPYIKAPYTVGTRLLPVAVSERGSMMDVTLWYPAVPPGRSVLVGDGSPLFRGTAASADAAIAEGRWPLIVLSQGGLRSGPNIGAWMAASLAADGFVVAMLRQPDPRRLTEKETLSEIWLRPADVSAALTAILEDTTLSRHIDADRVGVLGYQVGGTAALALAGGRLDVASVQASCDMGGVGVDCDRFRKANLDLRTIDAGLLGRSNVDPRVRAIVVVDPEFSRDFTRESLAGISIPVSLVNLGKPETIWPSLNAQGLVQLIPQAHYTTIQDASQFSAFPECKPGASAILREDGEEAICDDPPGGRTRAQIHGVLAQMATAAFRSAFSPKP